MLNRNAYFLRNSTNLKRNDFLRRNAYFTKVCLFVCLFVCNAYFHQECSLTYEMQMLILLCFYFWPGHIFSAWMLICNKYFFLKCLFSTGMLIFNKKAYFYPKCLFSTGELLILTHKCKFSWQENAFWTRYILYYTDLNLGLKSSKIVLILVSQ